jgi:cell division protein FtsI/penicillin-binding protein 2
MAAIMSPSGRIRVVTTFIFLIGFLLMVRLYYVQIVDGTAYEEKATRQYVHTSQDIFNRGTIYYTTKDGEKVGAASMKAGYVLAVNPEMITDAESVYEALDPHIDIDRDRFFRKGNPA